MNDATSIVNIDNNLLLNVIGTNLISYIHISDISLDNSRFYPILLIRINRKPHRRLPSGSTAAFGSQVRFFIWISS